MRWIFLDKVDRNYRDNPKMARERRSRNPSVQCSPLNADSAIEVVLPSP
jgi:hypothetical protein